jgi:hypothetical protein
MTTLAQVLTWIAFWTQWLVFGANVYYTYRNARLLKESREQVDWMDKQIVMAERQNEELANVVALYLAFQFKGLYW